MELSVQNVYGLLLRSRLLPIETARALHERWQKEAGASAASLEQFARWVVANGYLTEYQMGLLGRGHADGFFLSQYKVIDRLGKGRMAGVYKATHELGQVVAIKVLPPSRAKDPQMLGRFQREARLALALKHPNIVRAFQVGQDAGLHYLVMEYLEGETLDDVLQRRRELPPAEAVRLIYQALLGLQHIHEQGLVHRDLKPANLMLVPGRSGGDSRPGQPDTTLGCTVKVLDIGLGRALFEEVGAEKETPDSALTTLTTEGIVLGTPDYMSPEQARDPHAIDIRSDVYSLGCVLYHTLTGQPPFPDTNLVSQMVRHATEAPRPLKDFNPAIPDGLQQILNWMMAKDPAQRYPTPARAAQALQVFLAAGAEAQAAPEADAKMHSYLSWLEVEKSKEDVVRPPAAPSAARAPSGTIPALGGARPSSGTVPATPAAPAKPAPAGQATSPALPAAGAPTEKERPGSRSGKHRHRKHKRVVPVAAGAGAPPPAADGFDVELVPMTPPATKQRPAQGIDWHLSRRDFLMFGSGVGGTLLAIGMAWLLAHLFSRKAQPAPESGDSAKE